MASFSMGGVDGKTTLLNVLYVGLIASIAVFLGSSIGLIYAQQSVVIVILFGGTIMGAVGFMFTAGAVSTVSD